MKPTAQYVVFRIADRHHALPLESVERAVRAAEITPIPGAPEPMMGVLDVAGRVLPVLSIARRFGLAAPPITPDEHFVIARMGARTAVLPVDEVLGVVEKPAVVPSDAVVPGLERFKGVAQLEDGLTLIHDLEKFFSPDEWSAVDRSIAEAAS